MKAIGILFLVILVIALVIAAPLVAMWCVDTLFGTNIPVTFKTWVAMLILLGFAGGSTRYKSNS